jgi:predicted ATPase/DNA-binding SARP family transcriptional activator
VRIGILGALSVHDSDGAEVAVAGARPRALLVRLALEPGQVIGSGRLIEDLWPARGPHDPAGALQTLVARLRRALDGGSGAGRRAIDSQPTGYRLDLPADAVDTVEFEQRCAEGQRLLAEGDPTAAAAAFRAGLTLWRGPALADVTDLPFAAAPGARLAAARLAAVEGRVDADLERGVAGVEWSGGLVAELEELCAEHPSRESMQARLMRVLIAAGRRSEALAVFENVRRELADRLGVDPGPELRAAHLTALRDGPQARRSVRVTPTTTRPTAPATPGAAGRRPSGNLPARVTSFVGRQPEIATVGRLLAESRLVTLTGFGGVGKTRLAVEVAAGLREQIRDGVWLVELAEVTDPAGLPSAVLAGLGHSGSTLPGEDDDPAVRLRTAVIGRDLLLVLDNCEHLIEAVATFTEDLLAVADGVRVLATSREPLGIGGEALCPILPFSLPADDGNRPVLSGSAAEPVEPPVDGARSVAEALASPSVVLFGDRARAARPGFVVDGATIGDVVRICRELDGIPLAIELAAARLRSLTPRQLAENIGSRLSLLGRGNRTGQARHRTLRAVIDWSWDLLDPAERRLLRRLSVFAGGSDLVAVCAICLPDEPVAAVLDVLSALVDRSLVLVSGPSEVRYSLLVTVHQYAAEKLTEAGELDLLQDAHAEYFTQLAESAEPLLRGHEQLRWLAVLDREWSNVEGALEHAVSAGDAELALRLVVAAVWWWSVRGRRRDARQWAAAALRVTGPHPPPGTEQLYAICLLAGEDPPAGRPGSQALRRMGTLLRDSSRPSAMAASMIGHWLGVTDMAEIRRFTKETADWLCGHTDPWMRATGHLERGVIAAEFTEGGAPGAEEHLQAALDGFRSVGDRWGLVYAWWELSAVLENRGDAAEAVRALDQARRSAAELGGAEILPVPAMLLVQSGRLRARAGDFTGALAELARAQAVAERTQDPVALARVHHALGEVAWRRGDLGEADARFSAALELVDRLVDGGRGAPDGLSPQFRALVHSSLARSRGRLGRQDSARELHAAALAMLTETVDAPVRATVLEGVAEWCLLRDDPEQAAVALGAAQVMRGVPESNDQDLARLRARCVEALGEQGFHAALTRGTALREPQALALPAH